MSELSIYVFKCARQLRNLLNDMSHTIVIGSRTGITTQSWDLPQRLEWRDFLQHNKFNLTLLVKALQSFMNEKESTKLSYFQLAGKSLQHYNN